jgi:penicillin amidase
MKKAGKFLGRLFIGVLILAFIAGTAVAVYFKRYLPNTIAPQSFPQIEGEIKVEGLDAPVDIYRDHMGISHIYAASIHDLFFAQGYVHAQERFWQMDVWRHIGSGQLSEMFGKGQVETDAFLRTLGWRATAEKELALLQPESRSILQSYSDGVNAYLIDHSGTAVSLEYAILKLLSPDYKIEPWEPVHSLTWGKAMAWDLRGNMDEEIERAILLKRLTHEQVAELFPDYPGDHPNIVNQIPNGISSKPDYPNLTGVILPDEVLAALEYKAILLDPILGPSNRSIGSNSWAISGDLTASGMPLLANDPHLSSQMPSIWYQIDLQCEPKTNQCPYSVAGFSFAGAPGVFIGHNADIAWGLSNVGPDVMDLFVEKVNPENPNQYEVNGSWVDFETRIETINVIGADPVELSIRRTRHGPVISEVYGPLKNEGDPKDKEFLPFRVNAGIELPENYVIALAWTALIPSTPFDAIWGFDKARSWEEFRQAARNFQVPAQNLLYADTKGNIGYQMPGEIPIRKAGDGTLPVPGWTGEYDWQGFIPFEQLPFAFNPPEGYIVTANNRVPPPDYPYLITHDWDYGFRAHRILNMILSAPSKIDKAYMQKMQGDENDPIAEVLVPILLDMHLEFNTPNESLAYDLLKRWDFQASADSPAAAVFEAFWGHLLENTFDDELPKRYWPEGGDRWMEIMRHIAGDANNRWWDDQSTANEVETRDEIFSKSFTQAVQEVQNLLGKDPTHWSWGGLHTITFRNGTLGESGISLIEDLFNRGPFATGGSKSIIDATGWDVGVSYEVNWLPSMRMIIDLGDLGDSLTVHTTGQSGHAYHPHYDDMASLWACVQYYPMLWDQEAVTSDAEGHLILRP